MFSVIKKILYEEGIEHVGIISVDDCEIINARLLPDNANSAIMFTIPYRTTKITSNDGFSEYSRVYDYHNFCKKLYERTITIMKQKTGFDYWGFCDHSPVNEKLAIAKCGLGIIGRNSLFIDNEYGSYVFIGSLLTDMKTDFVAKEIKTCENCSKCIEHCPNSAIIERGIDRAKCLSGISQKKRKTEEEKALLKSKNIVWGCDICQNVCPHNAKAKLSPINYFSESRIQTIDKNFILQLSDDEFNKFAFAYKGKDLILNNIEFK